MPEQRPFVRRESDKAALGVDNQPSVDQSRQPLEIGEHLAPHERSAGRIEALDRRHARLRDDQPIAPNQRRRLILPRPIVIVFGRNPFLPPHPGNVAGSVTGEHGPAEHGHQLLIHRCQLAIALQPPGRAERRQPLLGDHDSGIAIERREIQHTLPIGLRERKRQQRVIDAQRIGDDEQSRSRAPHDVPILPIERGQLGPRANQPPHENPRAATSGRMGISVQSCVRP